MNLRKSLFKSIDFDVGHNKAFGGVAIFGVVLAAYFVSAGALANEIQDWDDEIRGAQRAGKLAPLSTPRVDRVELVRLGQVLYTDPRLSGNRDIACVHCHHPRVATTDGLPFSIGTGGKGVGPGRRQQNAGLTRRNSLALFNVGLADWTPMFWDGRVEFSPRSHSFMTPEPALNGYFPHHPQKRHPIARALDSSLAAQALFPMVDEVEMKGAPGTNEIADAPNRVEAWRRIMLRVQEGKHYEQLFSDAYPRVSWDQLNIGHVGTAIAAFERQAFVANRTPFDQYLRGDNQALTPRQKFGAALFVGKARCVECHVGEELSHYGFFTTGVPQIGSRTDGQVLDDLGRFEVETDPWLKQQWRYSFRTPPLRNVALTAPYMHNGAFTTLRQVVEHYSNPAQSLATFALPTQPPGYTHPLTSDAGTPRATQRLAYLDERLKKPLYLSTQEIDALVDFLENGLTDPAYLPE